MVISSTNMNKKNNHLSPQANEHNEKGTTYTNLSQVTDKILSHNVCIDYTLPDRK
jgi:hypothetical protein